MRRLIPLFLVLFACSPSAPPVRVPVAASAEALDGRTVAITFTRRIVASSARQDEISIFTPFVRPEETLAVEAVEVEGETLTLRTSVQRGGRLYAVRLGALSFEGVELADAPAQINFEGFGLAPVSLTLDARGHVVPGALTALVNLDPTSGAYTPDFRRVPLSDDDGDLVFNATVSARIGRDRMYAARAIDDSGVEAGGTVSFTVTSTQAVRVVIPARLDRLPEFSAPIDAVPGDGRAPVRIVLDDRFGRALKNPALRLSVDANGRFDLSLSRLEPLRPVAGKPRVWEAIIEVAVDPVRRIDGTTPDTFPYVTFLVNDGEDINERGGNFVMPEERPQLLLIPVANPALVPVTFRVEAGAAILEPDLSLRGLYPGEGVFLTGELPNAEDALGRLAADAFTGGERATLEMEPRPDAPGVYERTIFVPPNRPYGWKVVRCPTRQGCAVLNRHVSSSGRAFPTVMKNLTTANTDAGNSMAVRIIDPRALDQVVLEDGSIADYSRARVSLDGTEAPSPSVMFKQEAPDLVVTVGTEPVITPIYVVGTWRDVNIPERPTDIIASGGTLVLTPFDYDDGLAGRSALVRDLTLPLDPGEAPTPAGQPAFRATDGQLDRSAAELSAGAGRMPLWVGWNERVLYVATALASAGSDHFLIVSLDPPTRQLAAQWAKQGMAAGGARTYFLAMEGDGDFAGWFRRGATGTDDLLEGPAYTSGRGQILEGAIDLSTETVGPSIWVAAVPYGTSDGGSLDAQRQNPSGNGDANLDGMELREIRLGDVRAR